jgi:hypothetical protein
MENVKYWILTLLLIFVGIGWYCKSEDVSTFSKETLLTKEQKLKYIKKPHNNWYYKESTYKIVKKKK